MRGDGEAEDSEERGESWASDVWEDGRGTRGDDDEPGVCGGEEERHVLALVRWTKDVRYVIIY